MNQTELFYSFGSITLAFTLFILIALFNEIGFRFGRFVQNQTDDEIKALTGSIQASILGLLALLLGFTFSMSMQRYDNRSHALINEANAIGTVQLRTQLLPADFQKRAETLLQDYIELRVAVGKIDMTRTHEREAYDRKIAALQNQLWALAVDATETDPRPVTTGAFVVALNGLIDAQGARNALLQMHVPEVVLLLLFIVFIASGSILGYSSGLSGKRVTTPTLLVSFLIVLIVFIIIDLDRPKRGLIQIDQTILTALQSAMQDESSKQ